MQQLHCPVYADLRGSHAGPGLSNVPHSFYYPKDEASNFTVTQFENGDVGGQGLAEMVREVADESIKVRGQLHAQLDNSMHAAAARQPLGADSWHRTDVTAGSHSSPCSSLTHTAGGCLCGLRFIS